MKGSSIGPGERRIISSGNPELDSKMGGGLPAGSLTLIEGASGAGKSVLTQQLIFGALKDGRRVSLFTSETSLRSLMAQMQSLDMDVLDYLLLGRFKIYSMALSRQGENAPVALLDALWREKERDLLVVDSFTVAIARQTTGQQIRRFFESCQQICTTGVTLMVTLHSGDHTQLIEPVRSMCDALLTVRSAQDGQRLVKTLEVTKIRGAASATGAIIGFEVEPGWGMRVIPISKARG